MPSYDGSKPRLFGTFKIPSGEETLGELAMSGRESSLLLRHPTLFPNYPIPTEYVTGVLHDGTKVSLISCITLQQGGALTAVGEPSTILKLFPHFVVSGDRYIVPTEKSVDRVSFSVGDASTLFTILTHSASC